MINNISMVNQMLKDVLKNAREAQKLKQTDVAEYVGVTPQTYMKWENGKNEPKASNIKKLSEILKVSESEICRGELQYLSMEPLEFVRRVGILMNHVPVTEMLISMHEYINNPEGFINMLTEASDYPYDVLVEEDKVARKQNSEFQKHIREQEIKENDA